VTEENSNGVYCSGELYLSCHFPITSKPNLHISDLSYNHKEAKTMKKQLLIGLTAAVAVIGASSAVYAAQSNHAIGSLEQMLPAMKQMHPNFTDQQLQDMFNSCQTNNGSGMQQMMNNNGLGMQQMMNKVQYQ
jgi:hypothetical protein